MKKRVKPSMDKNDNSSSPGGSKAITSTPRQQQDSSFKSAKSQQVSRSTSRKPPYHVTPQTVSVLYSQLKQIPYVKRHHKLPGSHLRVTHSNYATLKNDIQSFMVKTVFVDYPARDEYEKAQRAKTAEDLLQRLEQIHQIGRNKETQGFYEFLLCSTNRPKAKFHVNFTHWNFTRLEKKMMRKIDIKFGSISPPQFGLPEILPPLPTLVEKNIKIIKTEPKQAPTIKKKLTLCDIIKFFHQHETRKQTTRKQTTRQQTLKQAYFELPKQTRANYYWDTYGTSYYRLPLATPTGLRILKYFKISKTNLKQPKDPPPVEMRLLPFGNLLKSSASRGRTLKKHV